MATVRRVRRIIRKIDPWTALKVSAVVWAVVALAVVLGGVIFWSVLDRSGVPDKLTDFRSRQGRDPNEWELGAIKREAAEDTRGPKSGNGVPELATRWQAEAASVGWDAPLLAEALHVAAREAGPEPERVGLDEIVAALSTAGSTWNRAQVMWALCDAARPQARLTGDEWAEVLERVVDEVIGRCVSGQANDRKGRSRRGRRRRRA